MEYIRILFPLKTESQQVVDTKKSLVRTNLGTVCDTNTANIKLVCWEVKFGFQFVIVTSNIED